MNVSRSSDATPSSFILSRADTMKAGLTSVTQTDTARSSWCLLETTTNNNRILTNLFL